MARGGRLLRQRVHERSGGRCHYCGIEKKLLTIDHVVPLAQGGTSYITNLVGACSKCNSAKGQLSAEVFIRNVLPGLILARNEKATRQRGG